ncbi:HipA domain-containing protein [Nocardia sp. CC216A]|uniref:HipA domain-containing protein n=1 Tax=unclassified Nocardia TaxID=2637762 RepID=UPI0035569E9E
MYPYLADPTTPPVAFTLPERAGKFRATGGSVPPFFAGLLPEGLRLTAITRGHPNQRGRPLRHPARGRRRYHRRCSGTARRRPTRRLPQEDACQILGRYPAARYRITLQEAIKALADAVAEGRGSRPLATLQLLEIAAFSYLIGNGDLHAHGESTPSAAGRPWAMIKRWIAWSAGPPRWPHGLDANSTSASATSRSPSIPRAVRIATRDATYRTDSESTLRNHASSWGSIARVPPTREHTFAADARNSWRPR